MKNTLCRRAMAKGMHTQREQEVATTYGTEFPVEYPDGHPINHKKANDLKSMIPFLPPASREFYTSLQDHIVASSDEDDDSD